MLATSYPLLDAFFTILWIVGFVLWIWLVIYVFADIFRSHDMSGWMKALWVFGVIVLPLIGVLLYLIVRGHRMGEHAAEAAEAQEKAQQDYIRGVVGRNGGSSGPSEELATLARLRDAGAISQEEFDREKSRILAHL